MTKMARFLGGALLVALVLGLASPGGAKPLGLLGIEQDGARPVALWTHDPSTLERLSGNIPLAGHGRAWSFSPDRSRIALASAWSPTLDRPTSLRLLEMTHSSMRVLGDIRLAGETASIRATAWVRPDRLLVLLQGNVREGFRLLAIDARHLRVVGQRKLAKGSWVLSGERTPSGFVLLLANRNRIGTATLATVDARLRMRMARLSQITAGSKHVQIGNDVEGTFRTPGLAVDRLGGRAFVVSEGQPVAEIALPTMRVRYHRVAARVPQARTKGRSEGTEANAEWLGNGLLAVAGSSYSLERDNATPTGLRLIDTGTWTERLVDDKAGSFFVAGSTLITRVDARLVGYSILGIQSFALQGPTGWIQTAGERLYVGARGNRVTTIVDGATGTVVGSFKGNVPRLLGDSNSF